ncbi:MAG TPA: helix-turn-helix domain-containing protein [Sphingobacteriaceae bacterium]
MKEVSIVVPRNALLAAVADAQYIFTMVNNFLIQSGKPAVFDIKLVGLTKEVSLNAGTYQIHTDVLIKDVDKTDLIIIPSMSGDMLTGMVLNLDFNPWFISQHKKGAEIASMCVGAFLLASSGLLKGKNCATHWLYTNEFRSFFPDVKLVDDKIITDQNGLYSSGGSSSYWNLLLYLVEKYTDRETAVLASKYFALDIGRNSQSAFTIFHAQKDHDDERIKTIQEYIEQNFKDKISIGLISQMFNIAGRSLERRFKKATGNTVIEYIQRVRIEAAKKQFEIGRKTVNEVMYEVGYTDSNTFRRVFKEISSISPVEYRSKYSKSGS